MAHRGASGYAPENTLAAFKMALEMGAKGIEIDIHLTADGEIVVIHDWVLGRTCDLKGLVGDYSLKEIKEGDFGGWFSHEFKNERIPTLEETLVLLKGTGTLLNIEIKKNMYNNKGIEKIMTDLIHKHDFTDQVIVSSFNHHSLAQVKRLEGNIRTGILYSEIMYHPWEYAAILKADAIHPFYESLGEEDVRQCLKNNIMVNPYTVNNPEHIARLVRWGVSSIITDYPDMAGEIVLREG